ncbi:MAG: hypothetical protein IT578_07165 [Verrucomicrobiae bacterium]|nr:hypothetical protein [Verrucomicrobiae bacterium]
MRREMEWKTRREDGRRCVVRVSCFAKQYRFRFKEEDAGVWDSSREPSLADLEILCETVRRRRQRRQASDEDLARAEELLRRARNLKKG